MKCELLACKYEIKSMFGKCKFCDQEYCRRHRLPFDHECNKDQLKDSHKKIIQENNPLIKRKKMEFMI